MSEVTPTKHDVLTITYVGRTVIVHNEAKEVVAAGSPKAVADTLKAHFVERVALPGV